MWILKNSKDLLEYIQSRSLSSCNSITTFDFSILYTTIPHSKLKDRIRLLVQLFFIKKNGQRRYIYSCNECVILHIRCNHFLSTVRPPRLANILCGGVYTAAENLCPIYVHEHNTRTYNSRERKIKKQILKTKVMLHTKSKCL
jgi:hypothetical protein